MIKIFRGDSMTDRFGRVITFKLETSLDVSGCSIVFRVAGLMKAVALNSETKIATLELSANETEQLQYGDGYASILITDEQNIRTITNTLWVRVTDSVEDFEDTENAVNISLVEPDWQKALDGVSWDSGASIGSLRDFLAVVGTALGAKVEAR